MPARRNALTSALVATRLQPGCLMVLYRVLHRVLYSAPDSARGA